MYKTKIGFVPVFAFVVFFVAAFFPVNALAETRWALIISGASGGEKYA